MSKKKVNIYVYAKKWAYIDLAYKVNYFPPEEVGVFWADSVVNICFRELSPA